MMKFEKKWINLPIKLKKILTKLLILLVIPTISFAKNSIINVTGFPTVIDGDTIKVNNFKIRFEGIDAPESYFKGKKQICYDKNKKKIYCGKMSKDILTKKIRGFKVDCKLTKKDRYKRFLGECYLKGESISSYMVRSGYAFAYRRYSVKFIKDELYAKKNELGLWSMQFEYPWLWRKQSKIQISLPPFKIIR